MTEQLAKSPYRRHNKKPFVYNTTPLNKATEGVKPTVENIKKWQDNLSPKLLFGLSLELRRKLI